MARGLLIIGAIGAVGLALDLALMYWLLWRDDEPRRDEPPILPELLRGGSVTINRR